MAMHRMKNRLNTSTMIWTAVLATFVTCTQSSLAAEYRLASGDTIELAIASTTQSQQRAVLGLDGTVSLPVLGEIKAAGLTLSELRSKVKAEIPKRMIRQRTAEGRELIFTLLPDEVTVNIAEYRPIYISGDVSRAGEQAFRPGMTVRHALAVAGGYDAMRIRLENPLTQMMDWKSEYEALQAQHAQVLLQIKRLKTELGEDSETSKNELERIGISEDLLAQISAVEDDRYNNRTESLKKETDYIRRRIVQSDTQIGILSEQQQKEKEAMQSDLDDLKSLKEFHDRGTVPITRVMDAKRASLVSASRLLQTMAQLEQSRKDREEVARSLDKVGEERRDNLLQELQNATIQLSSIRPRLTALQQKLLAFSGNSRLQSSRDFSNRPEIFITRKVTDRYERITSNEDTELMPGDVIEIALRMD
ncbi:polysaccharide export outer membrane protein [Microvirga flocculans]|uniref:Polysaccharide export outer membrane protein n=1 Tax=Microvirga flocculans TaxID=217168 RepID=A0A7W6IG10_9HYPH|nr:polysaccharide biosynthesis/export family protein [Microvirga flocculans]MBB4040793.1 polysaccharide export outer membrane protein [Microvirga flocculans]